MSVTTIIRPEFQLISANVDFVSTTGIEVKAGTTYARLYYPKGCTTTGQSIKGAVKLYDRIDKAGNRTICFIANPADYKQLHKACAKSNMAINRVRTIELLNKCLQAPAAYRPEVIPCPWSTAEQYAATQLTLSQPSFTTQLCLPAAKVNEIEVILSPLSLDRLRHIAKTFGVVGYSKYNRTPLVEYLTRQLTRRNINPAQVKSLVKVRKSK